MGTRLYTPPAKGMPALKAFERQLGVMLDRAVPIDDAGLLTPSELALSPEAKGRWIEYHDAVERELGQGGDLHDIKDVASKSADNAARLAGLFALFERGPSTAIQEDDFERAAQIAIWHLAEARRFLGEYSLPKELANAARLETWLVERCRKMDVSGVPRREVQNRGPYGLRDKKVLDSALAELVELHRAREVRSGKKIDIEVNPAILGGTR